MRMDIALLTLAFAASAVSWPDRSNAGERFQILQSGIISNQAGNYREIGGGVTIYENATGKIYHLLGTALYQTKEPYFSLKWPISVTEFKPKGQYSINPESTIFTELGSRSVDTGGYFEQIWRIRENSRIATWCIGDKSVFGSINQCYETKF